MHVIVAGGGTVGSQVAAALEAASYRVVVVEVDEARASALGARGMEVVVGNACVAAHLEAAGALGADLLVACTGTDEENLVIAELAKRYLEVPRVVARVNDDENRWLFDSTWGVDVALSAAQALAAVVEEVTAPPQVARLGEAGTGVILVEARLGGSSPAVGHLPAELVLAAGDAVAGVLRGGQLLPPADAGRLRPGDHVLVITDGTGGTGGDRVGLAFVGEGGKAASAGRGMDGG
ncbi:MAG: NAD-binding protein [Actinomycetota bacterium]|jgi:trk system potassium uptake protein TrkA|nr:NAD-binding protein [Actinomycetota bacterium]